MKRKERAAGYIRESNPALLDSNTIESQTKLVRDYCRQQGYDYTPNHEYREALSAYTIPYTQRPKLLELLALAKRKEFDVLVLSETRAISRRQVEIFVIYDTLQKYGIRMETVTEKFEDTSFGRFMLSVRSFMAEAEREQIYARMERGKHDRVEIGNAVNGHPKPAYGYSFADSDREQKARYEFNHCVIYVDAEGTEWTEVKVCLYMFELARQGASLSRIAMTLNEIGIPTPKKPWKGVAHWQGATIHCILSNRMYIGEVWINKWKQVTHPETHRRKYIRRPVEEQILMPVGTAPALIDCETFEKIQMQLAWNKQDSLRNNKHHQDLGILRAGYAYCGICKRRLNVIYNPPTIKGGPEKPFYACRRKAGTQDVSCNHNTRISLHSLDASAWEKVLVHIRRPELVRAKIAAIREENRPVISTDDVTLTIEKIELKMTNLYQLAMEATNDDTITSLKALMKGLEKQKRDAEAMLYDIEEDDEERAELEKAIVKFENWVAKVQPMLTNPAYVPSYDEKRLAVHILGVRATVYPTTGDWPYRCDIDITVPKIMEKVKDCINCDKWKHHSSKSPNGDGTRLCSTSL